MVANLAGTTPGAIGQPASLKGTAMTDTCDPVGPLASAALNDSESALGVTGHYPLDDMLASLPRADLTQDMHAAVSVNRFGLLAAAGWSAP